MTYPEPVREDPLRAYRSPLEDPMREYRWPPPETVQGTPIPAVADGLAASLLRAAEVNVKGSAAQALPIWLDSTEYGKCVAAVGWCAPSGVLYDTFAKQTEVPAGPDSVIWRRTE